MKVIPTGIPEVLIIEPRVFGDDRGFFYESYNERDFLQHTGVSARFVQDNHSRSVRGVLRGLHYQLQQPQGKLVRVIHGEVFDVAVDLRHGSATFGRVEGVVLSAQNKRMLWIPPGFAHGFLTLSEQAEFLYKTTDYWLASAERSILWNDATLAIPWPLQALGGMAPVLSAKDAQGVAFLQAEGYP